MSIDYYIRISDEHEMVAFAEWLEPLNDGDLLSTYLSHLCRH